MAPKDTTDADWANIAARLAAVPEAYGVTSALRTGMAQGLFAAPRQALACAEQTATWAGLDGGRPPWFAGLAADGPEARRAELDRAAAAATEALVALTRFLRRGVRGRRPRARRTPSGATATSCGPAQFLGGTDSTSTMPTPTGGPSWSASRTTCGRWGPASCPARRCSRSFAHLDAEGEAIEGEQALLAWLQGLMDETMDALDGTHFDLSGDVRKVEAVLAPPGSAAAAYYTPPSQDFSRPGRRGTRRSAAPGSRSGRTSAPGTTRACPATTSSSAGGWLPATSLSRVPAAGASSRATSRAGRSTPSG